MNNPQTDPDIERAAYHEASHVIVALHLDIGIEYVTIDPKHKDPHSKLEKSYHDLIQDMSPIPTDEIKLKAIAKIMFGGMVGEIIKFGDNFSDWFSGDNTKIDKCLHIIKPEIIGSCEDYQALRDTEYNCLKAETKEILAKEDRWDNVKTIANALLKQKTLTGNEVNKEIT